MSRDADETRKKLNRLAWLLDSVFVIPGLNFRFGVDALIGIIPGLGDLIGVGFSSYIVREAARLGVPKSVLARMVFNVAVEGFIGLVPFAGDLFDAAWKANQRNVQLLNHYLDHPAKTVTSSRAFVFVIVSVLIALMAIFSLIGLLIMRWVWQALSA